MDPNSEFNDIACVSCKTRKTRCNRAIPTCDGCFARRLACVYPQRKRRNKFGRRAKRLKGAGHGDDALSVLLDRILEVERKCLRLATSSTIVPAPTQAMKLADQVVEGFQSNSLSTSPPSFSTGLESPWEFDAGLAPNQSTIPSPITYPVEALSFNSRLQQAINEVKCVKQQGLTTKRARMDWQPSPDLCKAFVQNFYKHHHMDIFKDFFNIKLISLLPDIIDMPELSIEPATRILYYSILYHGSLNASSRSIPQVEDPSQAIYIHCVRAIPAWQENSSGTKTDLVASVLLMRAALQQCDLDLAWKMYISVCFCMRKLDLHNLNQLLSSAPMSTNISTKETDQQRRDFWALILVELFFRLLHDKPAILTANLDEWRVSPPFILSAQEDLEHIVTTLTFLVKSRLTLLLLQFNTLNRDAENNEDVVERIEELCVQIEGLVQEWSVIDSMAICDGIDGFWWMLYDMTLTAYSSIMIISRKIAVLRYGWSESTTDNVPITPLSARIARHIMELVSLALEKYPVSATACCLFGAFRCWVAYGCLAQHSLSSHPRDAMSKNDISLLEQVAHNLERIAENDGDLTPLVGALHELNANIHSQWGCKDQGYLP